MTAKFKAIFKSIGEALVAHEPINEVTFFKYITVKFSVKLS